MKTRSTILLSALALSATSLLATAQDAPAPADGGPRGPRPVPPLMAALDANKDGEIDAAEMANATAALKALDKNGDGKLSGEEIRPPRGDRGPRPDGDRPGRPRPDGDKKPGQ